MRRTPPVPVQVVSPFHPSNARFQKRLIDFDTGSAEPETQHFTWLRETMNAARPNSAFHVRLFGFASRLGDVNFNKALSQNRMNAVLKFMQGIDSRTLSSVEMWESRGAEDSGGARNDNSPDWRAVEVHVFIGEIPPSPVPPGPTPINPPPHILPPLPGGERYKNWSVAAPGGVFVAEVVGVGFNVFFIRNETTKEMRGYIQPVAGVGASISLSGLKGVWYIIQQIVTGPQYSDPDFVALTTQDPVTWDEVEGCLVRVTSAGAGFVKGAGLAVITFSSSGVQKRGSSGFPIKVAEDVFRFESVGENWQLGVNASVAVGPIFRVGG